MYDKNTLDWFRLINTKGVGPKTFWALLRSYKTANEALRHVSDPFSIEHAKKLLKSIDCDLILANDPFFPKSLKRSTLCPPILYYKGNKSLFLNKKIAIIGARNASISGKTIAKKLSENLSNDFTIVSGMARGIDTSSHIGSLDNTNSTIAVLPFGFDNIYPKENIDLFKKIVENGLVITQSPPGSKPDNGMFQSRNRIISLISDYLIVIEASLKSGTMATSQMALDLGCEIMVVPGSPLDSRNYGSNILIKNGATLIQNYRDVLENLNFNNNIKENYILNDNSNVATTPRKEENNNKEDEDSNIEEKVLSIISTDPISLDDISIHSKISIQKLLYIISDLEIKGKIIKYPNNEISLLK